MERMTNMITWMMRFLCALLSASLMLSCALAENAPDNDYEAKKAAYRQQLMEDDVTTDDLLIGSWVSFFPFYKMSYAKQLDQMAAAGINFNIHPYQFKDIDFTKSYWKRVEREYSARNMVYFIYVSDNVYNKTLAYNVIADKEHCVGYSIMDEPNNDERMARAGDLTRQYHEMDPERYGFVNLLPYYPYSTYEEYVQSYLDAAGPENIEYLSHDYYPIREGGIDMNIFAAMEVIRSKAYENGKLKTHAFPQSTQWNGTLMPNIDEMRWNVYAYLAYGFKGLTWFNLVCPGNSDDEGEGFRDSLIYRDGTIRNPELFADFSDLNWEVRGLSKALMNLDAAHAYHTASALQIAGTETLPEDFMVQPLQEAPFVISDMEAKDGTNPYVMLFNNDTAKSIDASFAITFPEGYNALEYLNPFTGEYELAELVDGVLTAPFRAGEGRLYRLTNVAEAN